VLRSSFDARLNSPRLLPSERPSSGEFAGAKDHESDHQDDDQLGHSNRTKHKALPTGPGAGAASQDYRSLQMLHRIIEIRSGRGQGEGVHCLLYACDA
jgi:hypothetical protein